MTVSSLTSASSSTCQLLGEKIIKVLKKSRMCTPHYVKKHGTARWISMQQVEVRVLEQLENLSEYFSSFLFKQKGFKRSERYE